MLVSIVIRLISTYVVLALTLPLFPTTSPSDVVEHRRLLSLESKSPLRHFYLVQLIALVKQRA